MSRWIRGRLGRPMASIVSVLMLVSLLMPLAPPPVQAQGEGDIDWDALIQGVDKSPVPLVVVDYHNRSDYRTGMLGREMASSLSMALQDTGKFSIVPQKEVDEKMQEYGLTVPLEWNTQAMLADHLSAPFTVSGDIESVTIKRTNDGTYAEVVVNTLVISRITRLPINGARIYQKSSPKLGYIANTDALVAEAIATAAYQIGQRILENRVPISTVLSSDVESAVRIRGGSSVGLQEGMRLVTVRQESVTGVIRIDRMTPSDSTCSIIENHRGIAPGDKAVPIFTLVPIKGTPEIARKSTSQKLFAVLGLAALAAIVGEAANGTGISGDPSSGSTVVTATPMADAALNNVLYNEGATIVSWGKGGTSVRKWIVYRIEGSTEIAIALVDGNIHQYVDYSDKPFIRIDDDGNVEFTTASRAYTYSILADGSVASDMMSEDPVTWEGIDTIPLFDIEAPSYGTASLTMTAPPNFLSPGETVSYRVQAVTLGSEAEGDDGAVAFFLKYGEKSLPSNLVTFTPVPEFTPNTDSGTISQGLFEVYDYGVNANYTFQISSDPLFAAENTETAPVRITTTTVNGVNTPVAQATFSFSDVSSSSKLMNATNLYARMGVRYLNGPEPRAGVSSNNFCNGYVFSQRLQFSFASSMLMRFNSPSGILKIWPGKGQQGRSVDSRSRRR